MSASPGVTEARRSAAAAPGTAIALATLTGARPLAD